MEYMEAIIESKISHVVREMILYHPQETERFDAILEKLEAWKLNLKRSIDAENSIINTARPRGRVFSMEKNLCSH